MRGVSRIRTGSSAAPALRRTDVAACVAVLCCLVAPLRTLAQPSAQLTIERDVLQVGETTALNLILRGVDRVAPPQIEGPEGLQIEYRGASHQTQVINFKTDRSIVCQYALTGTKAGRYTLGPFEYEPSAGVKITIPALSVTVAGAASGATNLAQMIGARLQVEPATGYVQQDFQLVLTIHYRGVNLDRQMDLSGLPESGLRLGRWEELGESREVIDGAVYEVRRFRNTVRALTAGEFVLKPSLRVGILVRNDERRPRRGFFDDPFFESFFNRTEARPYAVPVAPFSLVVKPLPAEGRPASFSGAVGEFDWQVDVRPVDVAVGEPVTLTMAISGRGNLESISAPALSLGEGFRTYEPKAAGPGDPGRKVFEQVIIPRDEKITAVPAIPFSYFDTKSGQYVTVTRGPFPLAVRPSTNATPIRLVAAPFPTVEPQIQGADIVYLKPAPRRWPEPRGSSVPSSVPLTYLPLLSPVALFALWLHARRRTALENDVARARREQAPRAARAAVRKAEAAARAGQVREVYEAAWEALVSYFGNRLNLPPGDVTPDRVLDALARGGAEAADRNRVAELFAACEAARFGGQDHGAAAPDTLLEDLAQTLRHCERLKMR